MEGKIETYIQNFQDKSYSDYLENFKKINEERAKCFRSKKCAYEFETTNKEIIKKKGDQEIYRVKFPKYIIVDERLEEIKLELKEVTDKIKLMQNIINIDSEKKLVDEYKGLRKKYIELEDEGNMLVTYLQKVNQVEEIEKKKIELKIDLNKKEQEKRLLYQEINLMKNKKPFEKSKYKILIEKYLDRGEIEKLKAAIKKLSHYHLMTDKIFFNINRNKHIGQINYLIEELPEVKHNKKKSGKTIKIKN